ncbi:MAG: Ig-like domain-containing protein, partial [Candidatus Bipolaricaulia bacterium]
MDIIYRLVSARMDELRRLCLGGAALLLMTGLLAPQAAQAQDRTPGTTPETTESAATPKANPPSKSLDDAFASESGNISTSIDGVGTNSSSAIVQVDKPSSGATVRRAFLVSAAAFRGDLTSLTLSEGSSSLTIDPTDYDARIDGAGSTENGRIEITSFISSIVDPASAGLIDITVEESSPSSLDGTVLAVIFDDPNVSETRSVSLVFGSQDLGGDSFSIGLAEPFDDASQDIEMSLGISFGFQGGGQVSLVDVNGTRMTSSAGGQDDCDIFEVGEESCGNGALLTVGGIGDDPANPDDPFNNSPTDARVDDELYTLDEFIDDGDTQVSVETENPSFDDNIFFAAFVVKGGTAVVGEGITLAPSSATNPAGTDHTVTATVQDADGSPVSGRDVDFEITAGPNAGLTGSDVTDSNGEATFTWSSSTAGTDVVIAETVDSNGDPLTSNQAKKTWTAVCDVPSLGPERIDRSANTVTNTITDNEG